MADEKSKGKQPIIHERKEHEGDSSRGSRENSPPKDQQMPARNAEEAKQRLRAMQARVPEPDETDERTVDEEQKLERRLSKLEGALRARRKSSRITNVSFEFGRPKLEPTEDMRQDGSNVYNRPTTDVLYRIPPRAISNNMANSEEMSSIKVALEGMGVPTENIANVILQAVIYCKDVSSSVYMDPQGTFEFPGGAIMADSVLGIMKDKAGSLRRVCRLYAPVTWNYMLVHNAPPADWAADGFQENTKFAAFDCFDYVENKAAIQPLDHIIRRPTPAEKVAHATHKRIALDKSNRNETYANLGTEITGGRLGPEIVRNFNNANNK